MAETQQQNLFKFDRDLEKFAKALEIDVTTVVKKIGFDLFGRIVKKTPVDTGRARASWTIAINEPDRTVAEAGEHKAYQSAPDEAAKAKANAGMAALKPYEPVWISNNLPYIDALEHGHSKQAPEGMVALSIQETEQEIDTATGAIR